MTSFDPSNVDEFTLYERKFWSALEVTLSDVLQADPSFATEYRRSLSEAPSFERLLALHDDPLDIASKLAGIPISHEIQLRYDDFLAGQDQRLLSGTLWHEQISKIPFVLSEPPALPPPRRSGLVSLPKLQEILRSLGYEYVGEHDGRMIWQVTPTIADDRMPIYISWLMPRFHTSHGYPAFETDFVLDLFGQLLALVERLPGPSSTVTLIKTLQRNFIQEFDL